MKKKEEIEVLEDEIEVLDEKTDNSKEKINNLKNKDDKKKENNKKKDKKSFSIFRFILKNFFTIIVLVLLVVTLLVILDLNVLPDKYLYLVVGGEAILFLLGTLLYNSKKILIILFGIVFFVVGLFANGAIYYYAGTTNDYLNVNFDIPTYKVVTEYYLVAGANNNVNSVEELDSNANINFYKYGRAIDKAKEILGKYNFIETDNAFNGLNDARFSGYYYLLPSARYKYVLEASSLIDDSMFKIIEILNVEEEIPVKKDKLDTYNIYLNGLDDTGIKRDFNLIISVNTLTHKVVLTSIPRDYYIDVPAYGIKDTLMCMGDLDSVVSKEALEKLFDIKLDYTFNVNTHSLTTIVDALGGLELCSNMNDTIGLVPGVYSGCRTYNGEEILKIGRYRMTLPGRDRSRQKNMRLIFTLIAKKLASRTTLTNYAEILDSMNGLYTTDVNKDTITALLKSVIENPNYEIIEQNVDGTDSVGMGHLNTENAWNMIPDMNTVNAASDKIKEVLAEK